MHPESGRCAGDPPESGDELCQMTFSDSSDQPAFHPLFSLSRIFISSEIVRLPEDRVSSDPKSDACVTSNCLSQTPGTCPSVRSSRMIDGDHVNRRTLGTGIHNISNRSWEQPHSAMSRRLKYERSAATRSSKKELAKRPNYRDSDLALAVTVWPTWIARSSPSCVHVRRSPSRVGPRAVRESAAGHLRG